MHKRLVNVCTIDLTLIPQSPILIKSGKAGADPTKPSMEFVETYHQGRPSIYLPGSSLKGAIRAHAERIVRTVGSDRSDAGKLWATDPLNDDYKYLEKQTAPEVYKRSCFTDQMFGNTSIASRIRIEDAYPAGKVQIEERNGVAIDRVFGSVAIGPFDFEVCTAGEFQTKLHLKNFTLAQLGLIGLVLRDLNEGWFGLGFAKSRGLGVVQAKLNRAIVQYPGCVLQDEQICWLGGESVGTARSLLGAGMFLSENDRNSYGFPAFDRAETAATAAAMDLGVGVELTWQGGESGIPDLFRPAVQAWCQAVSGAA